MSSRTRRRESGASGASGSTAASSSRNSNRPVCVFFQQGSGCWKKEKCQFRHLDPTRRANQTSVSSISINNNSVQADQHIPNNPTPCKFFDAGFCHRGNNCWFTHMDPSDLASTSTIPNPTQFRSTPIFNSRSSTATLRTSNTTDNPTNPPSAGGSSSAVPIEAPIEWECGICMEVPSSFGLLESCSHAYCLTCIMNWRTQEREDLAGRKSCPSCRTPSNLVIPSSLFHLPGPVKETIIENYKLSCSLKPCKNFSRSKKRVIDEKVRRFIGFGSSSTGNSREIRDYRRSLELDPEIHGRCIFGKDCLYSHDGYVFQKGFEELKMESAERDLIRDEERRRRSRGGRNRRNGSRGGGGMMAQFLQTFAGLVDEENLQQAMNMNGISVQDILDLQERLNGGDLESFEDVLAEAIGNIVVEDSDEEDVWDDADAESDEDAL